MKSSIAFVSSTESAIICKKTLQHLTAEQIDRLKTLSVQVHTDPEITVPAALIVLLGAEDPYVRVQVPLRSLNWAVNIIDDGTHYPKSTLDSGAIIQAWLSAGAPIEWTGNPQEEKTTPERKARIRDAAGRFAKAVS